MSTLAEELDQILKGANQPSTIAVDAQGLKDWAGKQIAASKSDKEDVRALRLKHLKEQVDAGVKVLEAKNTFDLVDFDPTAAARKSSTLDELGKLSEKLTSVAAAAPGTSKSGDSGAGAATEDKGASASTTETTDETENKNAGDSGNNTSTADEDDDEVEKGWEIARDDDPFPGDMSQLRFDRDSGRLLRRKSVQF